MTARRTAAITKTLARLDRFATGGLGPWPVPGFRQ